MNNRKNPKQKTKRDSLIENLEYLIKGLNCLKLTLYKKQSNISI